MLAKTYKEKSEYFRNRKVISKASLMKLNLVVGK